MFIDLSSDKSFKYSSSSVNRPNHGFKQRKTPQSLAGPVLYRTRYFNLFCSI